MILIALALAASPAAETPREFIARVYSEYRSEGFSPLAKPDLYFSPGLTAAIRKDGSEEGEVGYLDGDPLCDCQDYERISATVLQLRQPSRSVSIAHVRVVLGPTATRDLQLRLIRTAKGWRIDDVIGTDHRSLLHELQRSNAKR